MRPFLVLLLATVVLGSLALYFRFAASNTTPPVIREHIEAEGKFDLEITLTFDAGPDEFAFDLSDAPSIVVEHLGKEILKRVDNVSAGSLLTINDVSGIESGRNTFFVRCTPKDANSNASRAVRVRIQRDGKVIAEETLWSAPGAPVEGVVALDTSKSESES